MPPQNCCPSYFRDRGPNIWKQPPPPPPPRFCLVFQRHHTEIYDAAQLLIWFIAKRQMGPSEVMENRQLAPGSLSLAVFPDRSPKGKQICCCSGHNFNHFKHCDVMLASPVSDSCLVTVVWNYAMCFILTRITACDAYICFLHGLFF